MILMSLHVITWSLLGLIVVLDGSHVEINVNDRRLDPTLAHFVPLRAAVL